MIFMILLVLPCTEGGAFGRDFEIPRLILLPKGLLGATQITCSKFISEGTLNKLKKGRGGSAAAVISILEWKDFRFPGSGG